MFGRKWVRCLTVALRYSILKILLRDWMKIAIVTDTHAGARNDSIAFNEYFIKFFEDQFFPYIKEHNIRHVIHLGDIFDRRKYINLNTLSAWHSRVFSPLNKLVERFDIIIGNHDTYYKNTNEINSVDQMLSMYGNYNIFVEPTETKVGDLDVLYVPWICESNQQETYDAISKSKSRLCMGHLEIMGFEMHAGHINTEYGLTKDLFDKFYMTLSGHFHHKSSKSGIHYLGSPYPMTWGDWGDSRGFHAFDTKTLELEFIENPEQIFHKIYYDDSKETFDVLMQKDFTDLTGKYVRVIVQQKSNPYWFDKFIEKLQLVNPIDVNIDEGAIDYGAEDETFDEAKDTLSILMDCVKSLELETYEKETMDLLRNLYIEALSTSNAVQNN